MKSKTTNYSYTVPTAALLALLTSGIINAQSGATGAADAASTEIPPASNPLAPPGERPVPGGLVGDALPLPVEAEVAQADPSTPSIASAPRGSSLDAYSIVTGSENFTNFVSLIKASGLDKMLQEDGSYTVLAPRNDAFAGLQGISLRDFLLPANADALRAIVNYHILPTRLLAAEITVGTVATSQAEPLAVAGTDKGGVTIQGGKIVQTDVLARNGVIHAIDKVLIPPSMRLEDLQRAAEPETPGSSPDNAAPPASPVRSQ